MSCSLSGGRLGAAVNIGRMMERLGIDPATVSCLATVSYFPRHGGPAAAAPRLRNAQSGWLRPEPPPSVHPGSVQTLTCYGSCFAIQPLVIARGRHGAPSPA